MTILDLQTSHAAVATQLLNAIRRASIQLPDPWRWIQYTSSWDVGNYTYQADNRLESFTITKDSEILLVEYTYNGDGRVATTTYTSGAGVVTVTPTYDVNGNVTATAVTMA